MPGRPVVEHDRFGRRSEDRVGLERRRLVQVVELLGVVVEHAERDCLSRRLVEVHHQEDPVGVERLDVGCPGESPRLVVDEGADEDGPIGRLVVDLYVGGDRHIEGAAFEVARERAEAALLLTGVDLRRPLERQVDRSVVEPGFGFLFECAVLAETRESRIGDFRTVRRDADCRSSGGVWVHDRSGACRFDHVPRPGSIVWSDPTQLYLLPLREAVLALHEIRGARIRQRAEGASSTDTAHPAGGSDRVPARCASTGVAKRVHGRAGDHQRVGFGRASPV